jgi:hypothetical protein
MDLRPTTSSTRKRRRVETQPLPRENLSDALDSAIASQGTAELAVLYLISKYDFDINDLKSRIQGVCQ